MQLHKLACSYMSLHAVPFFVWAAHKNFAVLVDLKAVFRKQFRYPLVNTGHVIWILSLIYWLIQGQCTASRSLIMAAGLCLPQSSMTLTTVCLPLPWSFMAFPPCGGISQTISLFKLDIHNIITVTDELSGRVKNNPFIILFFNPVLSFLFSFFLILHYPWICFKETDIWC